MIDASDRFFGNLKRPVILATRKFRGSFHQCISRHPKSLRVVSPFIGKIPGFGTVVDFARRFLCDPEVEFQLVTRPPKRSNEIISLEQADALVKLGVDLLIRSDPPLHSKVYQFVFPEGDKASFIGSANFTKGGFELNDETVAFFRDSTDNERIEAELDRLSGRGSVAFPQWKALNARLQKGD